jgi:pimeloyl-ACP methyl ester carboxylesterase
VVFHGSIATGEQWDLVARELAGRHEVWLVDRRGRGLSGDAGAYSLAAEAADVGAVLGQAGPEAVMVAHSYGAIVALEALRAGVRPAAAVLYEPPLPVGGPVAGVALEPFAGLADQGRLDEALAFGLTEIVHVPSVVVTGMRQTPAWPPMAALVPTWTRELRSIDALGPGVERYAVIDVPLTFLLGEVTAPHHAAATRALRGRIPGTDLVTFAGQEHFAHLMVPGQVAKIIADVAS